MRQSEDVATSRGAQVIVVQRQAPGGARGMRLDVVKRDIVTVDQRGKEGPWNLLLGSKKEIAMKIKLYHEIGEMKRFPCATLFAQSQWVCYRCA